MYVDKISFPPVNETGNPSESLKYQTIKVSLKSKYVLKMGTHMRSEWIKGMTGHNNLAYFQYKLNPVIDPTCRICLQENETLHHLMTDCEATTSLQMDIMKNKIPLPDMTWSVKEINTYIQHPLIRSLMTYDT